MGTMGIRSWLGEDVEKPNNSKRRREKRERFLGENVILVNSRKKNKSLPQVYNPFY